MEWNNFAPHSVNGLIRSDHPMFPIRRSDQIPSQSPTGCIIRCPSSWQMRRITAPVAGANTFCPFAFSTPAGDVWAEESLGPHSTAPNTLGAFLDIASINHAHDSDIELDFHPADAIISDKGHACHALALGATTCRAPLATCEFHPAFRSYKARTHPPFAT